MYRSRSGPPAWFVTLVAFALVFAAYYLYVGFLSWMERGGQTPEQATVQAQVQASAAAQERLTRRTPTSTPRPSTTPVPPCERYSIIPVSANVRRQPSMLAEVLAVLSQGTEVCVLERQGEWYLLDADPLTRRVETGYMRADILRSLDPTATPLASFVPPPTVTLTPTATPTRTPTRTPSPTPTLTPMRTPNATPAG